MHRAGALRQFVVVRRPPRSKNYVSIGCVAELCSCTLNKNTGDSLVAQLPSKLPSEWS